MKAKAPRQKRLPCAVKVRVTAPEKRHITQTAAACGKSISALLRDLGHGRWPRARADAESLRQVMAVRADVGRLAGLMRLWLVSPGALQGFETGALRRLDACCTAVQGSLLAAARSAQKGLRTRGLPMGEPQAWAEGPLTETLKVFVTGEEKRALQACAAAAGPGGRPLPLATYLRLLARSFRPVEQLRADVIAELQAEQRELALLGGLFKAHLDNAPAMKAFPFLQRRAGLRAALSRSYARLDAIERLATQLQAGEAGRALRAG